MLLYNKLIGTCMSDINMVASYLMKIIELRDLLATIGMMKVDYKELLPIALNSK